MRFQSSWIGNRVIPIFAPKMNHFRPNMETGQNLRIRFDLISRLLAKSFSKNSQK